MPDGYQFALFLHIVGVFGIAGAATTFWFAVSWMRRAKTVQEMRPLAAVAVWSDRLFPVSALLVLVAGAYMVEDVDWGWGTGWINTSLIALILIGAGGGIMLTPRVRKLRNAVDAAPDGAVPGNVTTLMRDPILWGALHAFTLALFAIIWNMTSKPGDAQAGAVILLGFVLGAASAAPMAMHAAAD
jgi:uncharacterized membrane protein